MNPSPPPFPRPPAPRATGPESLRMYPAAWTPAMLRATGAELTFRPRPTGAPTSLPDRAANATRATRVAPPVSRTITSRVPPLVLMLAAGLSAAAIAQVSPAVSLSTPTRYVVTAGLGLTGVACSLLGVVAFRRARTTVNPLQPAAATTLAVAGVYRFTRNPMYLGFLFGLLAEIVWLGSPVALLAAAAFVVALNRWQITPEERALRARFGTAFTAYTTRVPRWL